MVQLHCVFVIVGKKKTNKKSTQNFFLFCHISPQASHQEMANPLPVVAQEDLESFTLTRTVSGFALKAFHISWNAPISVKLLSSQDTTDRYGAHLPSQPHSWAAQSCSAGTRTSPGSSDPKHISIPRNPHQPRGSLGTILLRNKLYGFLHFLIK